MPPSRSCGRLRSVPKTVTLLPFPSIAACVTHPAPARSVSRMLNGREHVPRRPSSSGCWRSFKLAVFKSNVKTPSTAMFCPERVSRALRAEFTESTGTEGSVQSGLIPTANSSRTLSSDGVYPWSASISPMHPQQSPPQFNDSASLACSSKRPQIVQFMSMPLSHSNDRSWPICDIVVEARSRSRTVEVTSINRHPLSCRRAQCRTRSELLSPASNAHPAARQSAMVSPCPSCWFHTA